MGTVIPPTFHKRMVNNYQTFPTNAQKNTAIFYCLFFGGLYTEVVPVVWSLDKLLTEL